MSTHMRSLCCLLLIIVAMSHSDDTFIHTCVHDKLGNLGPVPSIVDFEVHDLNARSLAATTGAGFIAAEAQPIRIVVDTSGLQGLDPAVKSLIEQNILPTAVNFFQKRIKVMPQKGPIKFPNNFGNCQTAKVPAAHIQNGVSDADLVLYVTHLNEPKDTYLAWATACLNGDASTNFRPMAGQINFNSARLKNDVKVFEKQMDTTLHEMIHVLAFSTRLFGQFRKSNGELRGYENVIAEKKIRNINTDVLITPKLVSIAKEHYKCDSITEVALENEGGYGSRGTHFERSVLNNEMMTASISPESTLSKFTLALLEDSGWYGVDYNLAEPFTYGKNRGCNFPLQVCTDPNQPREYCYNDDDLCSFSYYQKSFCFKKDDFGDHCGYASALDTSSKDCRIYQEPRSVNIYGEAFGPNSKCVKSNFAIQGWTISGETLRCMEYKCSNGKVFFYINGKEAAVCSKEKEIVNAPKGYQGNLECPDPESFCEPYYLLCPNYCSGKGYCFRGQCECKSGSKGADCSE